jgi:hypothetical protein
MRCSVRAHLCEFPHLFGRQVAALYRQHIGLQWRGHVCSVREKEVPGICQRDCISVVRIHAGVQWSHSMMWLY